MKVIPPITITDAMLTSSSVPEPSTIVNSESAWLAGTTYVLGAYVIVVTANSHLLYQSLQAGNTGNTPATSPTWWLALGNSNKWAMFSLLRNAKTYGTSPMTIVLTPGQRIDSFAVLAMVADSVRMTMTSVAGGGTVFDQTVNLSSRYAFNGYDYAFLPFTFKQDTIFFNLPPFSDAVLTLTLTRASGNVACGSVVMGTAQYLGAAQLNAKSDVMNFSTVTRDAFGNTTMVQRRNIPTTDQTLFTDASRINSLILLQQTLNAAPAVWSGLDDPTSPFFESLLILGFYRTFTITLDQLSTASVNLVLEEI